MPKYVLLCLYNRAVQPYLWVVCIVRLGPHGGGPSVTGGGCVGSGPEVLLCHGVVSVHGLHEGAACRADVRHGRA